jgi:subtilisin family serine protease
MRRIGLVLLLGSLSVGHAAAGGIEPFLARLPVAGAPKASARISPLFVWDEGEAAHGRARIWVQKDLDASWDALRAAILQASPSSVWETDADAFGQLVAPWQDLERIAAIPGVSYILRPPRGVPTVQSEGLPSIRVPAFRAQGYAGEGARVAVVDLGFKGYQTLLGSELPAQVHARSFFRSPSGEGDIIGEDENHGTACAEIVSDIAPGAQLYLVNAESPLDLRSAVDWLVKEKVSVISHSIGWYFGGLDGTGPIDEIADDAARRGVLWVNAAGNEAERHTWAPAADVDDDGYLEFDSQGDERIDFSASSVGGELMLALLWDSWPLSTNLDLVLEVVDDTDQVLATSAYDYEGYPYAFRYVDYLPGDVRPVAAKVRLRRGSLEGRTIHLFRIGSGTHIDDHQRRDRSLLSPADSPNVLAVGAVYYATEELDSYSSRGAFEAVPAKPELCAPVRVTTATYGTMGFSGTSAAAPHVAGAAALLASAGLRGGIVDVTLRREEILSLLQKSAKPAPNITPLAWGILRLPVAGSVSAPVAPILFGNPAHGQVRWLAPCDEVDVCDPAGRIVGRAADGAWDGLGADGRVLPAGVYWLRCPGGGGATRLTWLGRR